MEIKVKKGIERPLIIQGMLLEHFYYWVGVCILSVFIIGTTLFIALKPQSSITKWHLFLSIILSAIAVIGVRIYFSKKSRENPFKKDTEAFSVSNVDLFDVLK